MNYVISNVIEADLPAIYKLASRISEQFVMPTLSAEGQRALRNAQKVNAEDIVYKDEYGARKVMDGDRLVAYIAWRDENHVAQLFVDSEYQGYGLGRMLLDEVVRITHSPVIKVRASLNAVSFYENYGFKATGEVGEVNNIAFVPMEYAIP